MLTSALLLGRSCQDGAEAAALSNTAPQVIYSFAILSTSGAAQSLWAQNDRTYLLFSLLVSLQDRFKIG